MRKEIFSVLVAASALLATGAQAQDCLRLGQLDSFSAIKGTDTAFVAIDKAQHRFKVNLMHRCGGLDYNMAIGFKTLERGRLACISRGDSVLSRDPGQAGALCPISSVVPYTPAMEAADKAAYSTARR